MKKQFTLLTGLLVAFGSFAQISVGEPTQMKSNPVLFKGSKMPASNSASTPKAAGDVLWSNNFNNTTNWQSTAIGGTPGANFGWQFATAPNQINSWAFSTGINSTSDGGYAIVENGDPNGGNVVANSQWIMTYDSIFDFSAVNNVVFQFEQYGARFIDNQVVEASNDGGTTWVEIGNNDDLPQLTASGGSPYTNPNLRQYNVTQAFGGATLNNLKIRFRVFWDANAGNNSGIMYGWYVDDVKFIEGYQNDLRMNEAFALTGTQKIQYSKFPASQAVGATTAFSSNIANIGGTAQDVTLNVTSGSFNNTSSAVNVAAFATDSLVITPTYTIPSTVGVNNMVFTANSTSSTLDNTTNDAITIPFEVTSKVMAVDKFTNQASIIGGFFGWATPSGDPAIGTLFECFNTESVGAIQIGIAGVNTADQPDYLGRVIYGQIHVYNAATDAFDYVGQTEDHNLATGEFATTIRTYFTSPITLEAGNVYLVTAATFDGAEVPVAFSGYIPAGNTIGFDGTDVVSLIANGTYGNTVSAPVVRLDFNDYTGITELENASNVMVAPNPFNNNTTVSFNLKSDSKVAVAVTDLAGRVVYTSSANMSAGQNEIAIDGSSFNAGVYTVAITSNGATTTQRIVKK